MDNIEKIDLSKIDWKSSKEFFESLTSELEKLEDRDESYNFTWVGKRKSIIEAGRPVNKIFRPDVDASKDFDNTKNMLIVGDNLDALKILQESYLGQVKMIYIDPPYNTGHDFVYHDNFSVKKDDYEDSSISKDGERIVSEDEFTENSKSNGRFHSDWLSMMYPRLKLARNLLSDDGVIFISIDDNEQANLKKLCDEVFGEENFISCVVIETANGVFGARASQLEKTMVKVKDYVLIYTKNDDPNLFNFQPLYMPTNELFDPHFSIMLDDDLSRISLIDYFNSNKEINAFFDKYRMGVSLQNISKLMSIDEKFNDLMLNMSDRIYQDVAYSLNLPEEIDQQLKNGKTLKYKDCIIFRTKKGRGERRQYVSFSSSLKVTDTYIPRYCRAVAIGDLWCGFNADMKNITKEGDMEYSNGKKPIRLIKQLVRWYNSEVPDSLILDFFAGSGTTGHAVMDLNAEDGGNRKYILVQWPEETNEKSEARKAGYETIDQITAERLRRAGEKVLKDHPDAKIDTGFRVFRIDDSNEKENIRKPLEEYTQESMLDMVDNLKSDRTPLDLLFEAIYASALPFDLHLETRKIGDNTVYLYGYLGENSGLAACFDDAISDSTIKEIAKLKPIAAVFKDSSFADSAAKINLSEHFRILAVDTKVKVI